MLAAISAWVRKRASLRRFSTNAVVFALLQMMVLALRQRLAAQAPAQEPPLDYRMGGYSATEALRVMRGYGPDARATAALLEAADCLYSVGYALLFAGHIAFSVSGGGLPARLHLLNLVPAATAAVDLVENSLMLALLAGPRAELAQAAVAASALKWRLLGGCVVVSVVLGLTSLAGMGKKGKGPRGRGSGAANKQEGGGGGGGGSAAGGEDAAEGKSTAVGSKSPTRRSARAARA